MNFTREIVPWYNLRKCTWELSQWFSSGFSKLYQGDPKQKTRKSDNPHSKLDQYPPSWHVTIPSCPRFSTTCSVVVSSLVWRSTLQCEARSFFVTDWSPFKTETWSGVATCGKMRSNQLTKLKYVIALTKLKHTDLVFWKCRKQAPWAHVKLKHTDWLN